MYYKKLVKYFYIFVTFLTIFSPVNVGVLQHLLGLLFMWFTYFVFFLGLKRVKRSIMKSSKSIGSFKMFPVVISIAYLVFYPVYVQFYTGQDVFSAAVNVFYGVSNYSSYQEYFSESGLNSFSTIKIPFIIGHGLLRFLFVVIVIRTIVYQSKIELLEKFSLLIMSIMIILVGLARGTSFELFELLMIYIYAIFARRSFRGYKNELSINVLAKLGLAVVLFGIYFSYNVGVRMGDDFNALNNSGFNKSSLVFSIFPSVAVLFYFLYDYFVFGIYFTSITITELWFGSLSGFLSMFIPGGIKLLGIDDSYRDFVGSYVNLGARWNSDTVVIIERYGIMVLMVFIYFLGYNSTKIFNKIDENIAASVILFYVIYIMISLPVGNFITTSSANVIAILFGVLLYKYKWLNKLLFNYLIPKYV